MGTKLLATKVRYPSFLKIKISVLLEKDTSVVGGQPLYKAVMIDHPDYVCQLQKAISGLKQAFRAWYKELSSFLLEFSFHNSIGDASLFIYKEQSHIIYFLVYVDDLIVTGNNQDFVSKFVAQLSQRFSLKDVGNLHFFLGVEVIPTKSRLFLSQHKYMRDVLEKFHMAEAKEVQTPLATNVQLKLNDGTGYVDATKYRQLIGSLQ